MGARRKAGQARKLALGCHPFGTIRLQGSRCWDNVHRERAVRRPGKNRCALRPDGENPALGILNFFDLGFKKPGTQIAQSRVYDVYERRSLWKA